MGQIADRLSALGLALPPAPAPVASYAPFVVSGATVFISGQISKTPDDAVLGRLGDGLGVADGQRAARLCRIRRDGRTRRSGPARPMHQNHGLCRFCAGFHRTARRDQWRFGFVAGRVWRPRPPRARRSGRTEPAAWRCGRNRRSFRNSLGPALRAKRPLANIADHI